MTLAIAGYSSNTLESILQQNYNNNWYVLNDGVWSDVAVDELEQLYNKGESDTNVRYAIQHDRMTIKDAGLTAEADATKKKGYTVDLANEQYNSAKTANEKE